MANLIELLIGEQKAGKYFIVLQREYRKICCQGKKIPLPLRIYVILALLREQLLERCITGGDKEKRLHAFNDLLNHLGEPLAIPGYESVEWFKDRLGSSDHDAARQHFSTLYTATRIQIECQEALLASKELLEEFKEWCWEQRPANWGAFITTTLQEMQRTNRSHEAIKQFLTKNGIEAYPNEPNFEEVLTQVTKAAFFAKEVFHGTKLRPLAVSRLLAQIHPKPILTSKLLDYGELPQTFTDVQLENMISNQ
jgi:hypothetical protein